MWHPALKGIKLKLFFKLRLTRVKDHFFNALLIHMLQIMQPAVTIGTLLCNVMEFGIRLFEKYRFCGPQHKLKVTL